MTFDAIQFNGENLREVYDFICKYHGNANNVTFEELLKNHRPNEIPLEVDSNTEVLNMERIFNEKWKDVIDDFKKKYPHESMKNHPDIFPKEFLEDRRILHIYRQVWRKNELYHFYLTNIRYDEECSTLIGIRKGDWFTNCGNPIEYYSEDDFKTLCKVNNWKEVE